MKYLKPVALSIIGITLVIVILFYYQKSLHQPSTPGSISKITSSNTPKPAFQDPLSIEDMRQKQYPGSDLTIEQTLAPGSNYTQYIASYKSDGLKIYGLLTIPQGDKPQNGWPVIIFNHGYIPPDIYRTTERYVAYVDAFARNGYIVFKPDFRGNGQSEGSPEGTYYSPAYTTDALNALATLKKYKDANPEKIGMWGHSMGGNITLRSLVVDPNDIKVAVIWGGVVGSYSQILNWHDPAYHPPPAELALRNRHKAEILKKYGTPDQNPTFWNAIDPTHYLSDISAEIQLHQGESDEEVPMSMPQSLYDNLKNAGKTVEFYSYPGDNHNISNNFNLAMQRSVDFFNKYLK